MYNDRLDKLRKQSNKSPVVGKAGTISKLSAIALKGMLTYLGQPLLYNSQILVSN